MNGCGPCESHGGGCGAHDGTAADSELTGATIPGKGVKPIGRLMPLTSGVNDPPAGFGTITSAVSYKVAPGDTLASIAAGMPLIAPIWSGGRATSNAVMCSSSSAR